MHIYKYGVTCSVDSTVVKSLILWLALVSLYGESVTHVRLIKKQNRMQNDRVKEMYI